MFSTSFQITLTYLPHHSNLLLSDLVTYIMARVFIIHAHVHTDMHLTSSPIAQVARSPARGQALLFVPLSSSAGGVHTGVWQRLTE